MPRVLWTLLGRPAKDTGYDACVHCFPDGYETEPLPFSWQALANGLERSGAPRFETVVFFGTSTSAWFLTLNPLIGRNREDALELADTLQQLQQGRITTELLGQLERILSTDERQYRCIVIDDVTDPAAIAEAYGQAAATIAPGTSLAIDITHGLRSHAFLVQEMFSNLRAEVELSKVEGPFYAEKAYGAERATFVDLSATRDFADRRSALLAHRESGRIAPFLPWIRQEVSGGTFRMFEQLSHAWESNDPSVLSERAAQLKGEAERLKALPVIGGAIEAFVAECRGERWVIERKRAGTAAARRDWIVAFIMLREAFVSRTLRRRGEDPADSELRKRDPELEAERDRPYWNELAGFRNRVAHGVSRTDNMRNVDRHRDPSKIRNVFEELVGELFR
jgi:hypothetical protein